jgi:nicotinate-nucleotide pyrophosphorylase (carboxylating)
MNDFELFFIEDLGSKGDITSKALLDHELGQGIILAKDDCILAGAEEAKYIFEHLGGTVHPCHKDGCKISQGTTVLQVEGPAQSILSGERLALNFLGRMSGIATLTRELVDITHPLNPHLSIAATRKTTPGFRKYEKKAVVLGGGFPHRFGLYDAILIKDNHIALLGSIEKAIKKAQKNLPGVPIEVEVENMKDALIAARLKVDVIMLDNIPPNTGVLISQKIREIFPEITIEVSGNITPKNIIDYVYADRISLGWLTHSVISKNFSLDMSTKKYKLSHSIAK